MFARRYGASFTFVTFKIKLLLDAVAIPLLPVIVTVRAPEKFAAGEKETTLSVLMMTIMLVFPDTEYDVAPVKYVSRSNALLLFVSSVQL